MIWAINKRVRKNHKIIVLFCIFIKKKFELFILCNYIGENLNFPKITTQGLSMASQAENSLQDHLFFEW